MRRLQGPPGVTETSYLCREWAGTGQAGTAGVSEQALSSPPLQRETQGPQGHAGRALGLEAGPPGPQVCDNLTLFAGAKACHGALHKIRCLGWPQIFQPKAQAHISSRSDQLASPPSQAPAFPPPY